jgi:hypothetical protein
MKCNLSTGISTITAGRILKGQLRGNNGEEEITAMESLDHVGLAKVMIKFIFSQNYGLKAI